MSSRPWEELVAEGIVLVKSDPLDRWALGDLALEAVPPGTGRADKSAAQLQLARFADDIGYGFNPLKDCYYAAKAWPPGTRVPGASYAVHAKYRARQNRLALVLDDVEPEMEDVSLSEREEVVKVEELLRKPRVRAKVLERSKSRTRKLRTVVGTVDDEEIAKAKVEAKLKAEMLEAERRSAELLSDLPMQTIRCNQALLRVLGDLLDLQTWALNVPEGWRERSIENAANVRAAAERLLTILRPESLPPLRQNADVIIVDDTDEEPTTGRCGGPGSGS